MPFSIDVTRTKLINALIALGDDWHSRQDLAKYFGKKRLNQSEETMLDVLVSEGRVERKQIPSSLLPHILQWVYRIGGDTQ